MLEKRTGYHNYEHIFEWLREGIVTYEDYAQMIADDVAETERLALMGLAYADIKEAEFNWDLFETTRAELIDTVGSQPIL